MYLRRGLPWWADCWVSYLEIGRRELKSVKTDCLNLLSGLEVGGNSSARCCLVVEGSCRQSMIRVVA